MDTQIGGISVITIVIVQSLKMIGINIKKEHMPLLSAIIGALLYALYRMFTGGFNSDFLNNFLSGIVAGLTASGGYDALKSLGKKLEN